MDRNTVIGLVIIGVILSVFTIFNKPSEEEIKAEQERIEQIAQEEKKLEDQAKNSDKDTIVSHLIPKLDQNGKQLLAEDGSPIYLDTISKKDTVLVAVQPASESNSDANVSGELIRLENEKLIIDFTTKGGQIAAVRLKEFETYKEYSKNDDKIEPLPFFKEGDATNGLKFPLNEKTFKSEDQLFTVKSKTDSKIVFEYKGNGSEAILFSYELKPNAYDLDYTIKMDGYSGKVTPKNVMFSWNASLPKTERLFSEQRRVSTICYNYKDEGFTWLSEIGDSEEEAEDKIEWLSFKQSYFSSILQPEKPFGKDGSKLSIDSYEDHETKAWTHLKGYSADLNLNISDVDGASVKMQWFFGPNDFKTLTSYKSGYDDILNYGWGIFRWINVYAVQPLYNLLNNSGLSAGLAILILTLILKLVLMPIQWKMYTSSAKMRILRPEIEEINAKYPDKEDAMKKQMETMALYRESGASPLAGCVPMLIQMPILLAVFRFFPSTFDIRQKSFLWAEDLSSYDSVWDFGTHIWFYGDHVSLFTLLMAGTTLIYTAINSGNMQTPNQPGMPNMKIIMYFFPIMMIFFFNNYSAGLSYYYFISTLISILIMLAIKRFFVDEEKLKAKMAARKATSAANPGRKKTKSKFQERLEQMQKAQQEQLKNKKK